MEERECSSTGESNEGGSVWRRSVHCVYNPTHGCREEEGNASDTLFYTRRALV